MVAEASVRLAEAEAALAVVAEGITVVDSRMGSNLMSELVNSSK